MRVVTDPLQPVADSKSASSSTPAAADSLDQFLVKKPVEESKKDKIQKKDKKEKKDKKAKKEKKDKQDLRDNAQPEDASEPRQNAVAGTSKCLPPLV